MKLRGLSFLVVAILFMGCTESSNKNQPMKIGVAKVEISANDTIDPDDPVYAKAMVFQQGKVQCALVVVDLEGLHGQPFDEAVKLITQRCGISMENICLTATHTHSNPKEPEDLGASIAEAVVQAQAQLKPSNLFAGKSLRHDLSFNRRFLMKDGTVEMNPGELNPNIVRPVGPIDPEINMLSFRDSENNKPYAGFTSFAVHVCTSGIYDSDFAGKTNDRKADFPYWLEKSLCAEYGQDYISVFGEATCEDLNHIDVNRPNRERTVVRSQFGLIDYVPRKTTATPSPMDPKFMGDNLADEVKKQMPDLKLDIPNLNMKMAVINAPLGMYSEMDSIWEKNTNRDSVSWLTQFRIKRIRMLENLRAKYGETIPLTVQVIQLSKETAIVALPGQVFVELGLAIKKASPYANTIVLEIANEQEYIAIIPNRKAYAEGHFEIIDSVVETGGGEMLVDTAIRLLKELKSE